MVILAKDLEYRKARGFYPLDLDEKEFHQILISMLKENKVEEVRKILNRNNNLNLFTTKNALFFTQQLEIFEL